jgi:hypothetical protein
VENGYWKLTNSARKHVALFKRVLEFRHADAFLVHDILGRSAGEEPREAVVEVDEILCDTATLGLVCLED